jgi:hypothetical protein
MISKKFSIDDLKAEIDRRQEEAKKAATPQPLNSPDFTPVIQLARCYITDLEKNQFHDDDYKHWIFEAVTEAVYGKTVWDWVNHILRGD